MVDLPKYRYLQQIQQFKMNPNSEEPIKKNIEIGRWSQQEHQRFMMGITLYGKDWKKLEEIVKTRTGSQVRSHAQKFFNKLKKGERKNIAGKSKEEKPEGEISDSEFSLIRGGPEDHQNSTPLQLVSLIRKQSEGGQKVNIGNLRKKLEDQMVIKEQQKQEDNQEQAQRVPQSTNHNSYKRLNNILEAYENIRDQNTSQFEDQSFLLHLTKRYKKYFQRGGSFENLIDFGNPDQTGKSERSIRKRSFTIPEGIDGDEDDLNERKKRILTETQATAKQKQVFRSAILQKRPQSQQQSSEVYKCKQDDEKC